MNNKVKPIAGTNNRVIIKRDELPKEEKIGSLYIATNYAKDKLTGKIVAVSDSDDEGKLPKVKVGDTVLFEEFGVKQINITAGQEYLTCRESSIIAVLSPTDGNDTTNNIR